MPKLQFQVNSRYLDGLFCHRVGFNWYTNDKNIVQLFGQMLWRPSTNDLAYLADPAEWSSSAGRKNNSVNAAWTHMYNYFNGQGRFTLSLRAPILQKDALPFTYSYAQLESVNSRYLHLLEIRTRVFARYGLGRQMPNESMLYMAGASPEEQMENKFTRSIGFAPTSWQGTSLYDVNHLQQGGGLNLRGYAGYFSPDEHNNGLLTGYKGRSGASASVEISFENYLQWRPRLTRNWLRANLYAFGDAGVMELSSYPVSNFRLTTPTSTWSTLHADAGVGCAFTIKSWGVFEKAKPLTLRFDVPFFLNRPPYSNSEYLALRYVIGINRSF
jgi:aminopeptidase N